MQFGFGSGLLYTTRTDIAGQPTIRFGAFQDLQLSFSGEVKELFGQNQFALDVARGKVKIEGKAKFAQISTPIMNAIFFGGTVATGQTISQYAEAHSVPASTPFTVVLTPPGSGVYLADLGVYDALSGDPYTRVIVAPTATKTYEVDATTGTYTFNTADEGKAVLIDYQYTATTGFTLSSGNPLMGVTPRFSASFAQTYGGNTTTILMPNCVSSKLTLPTKIDDYVMEEFDFQAFAGAGSPITLSTTL